MKKFIFSLAFLVASVSYSGDGDDAASAPAAAADISVVEPTAPSVSVDAENFLQQTSGFVKSHQKEIVIAGALLVIGAVVVKRMQARRAVAPRKA